MKEGKASMVVRLRDGTFIEALEYCEANLRSKALKQKRKDRTTAELHLLLALLRVTT
jgi:hypothetical protein